MARRAARQSRTNNDITLPASARAPDGSDEESRFGPTDGNRGESQQAATAQSGLFPSNALHQRGDRGKHPAVTAAESGDDRTAPENRIRPQERNVSKQIGASFWRHA